MAELARWQWDDIGVWRDFAEQYQAEMEACYQRREPYVELAIPPFGTFRMDLQHMKQVTVRGRNAGYERDIRRQARKIEVGYFILGCEGEIFASDSVVDQIERLDVLETMEKLLGKILEEPEDFEARSIGLVEDPFRSTLGSCEQALQFLSERGFELIEEGNARFLVFMLDDVTGLAEAQKEVQARKVRLQKQKSLPSNSAPQAAAASAEESNDVNDRESAEEGSGAEDNNVAAGADMDTSAPPREEDEDDDEDGPAARGPAQPAQRRFWMEEPRGGKGRARLRGKGRGKGSRYWRVKQKAVPDAATGVSRFAVEAPQISSYVEQTPQLDPSTPAFNVTTTVHLVLPNSGKKETVVLKEETLEELLELAKAASGLRLPFLATVSGLGLAAEPELTLPLVTGLKDGHFVAVSDFEPRFAQKLQTGLLRLEDLACVAPLLDWEKPELQKLFLGRMRSLLEGSSQAWCKAAGCNPEEELAYGRALLRRLYGHKPLEARLEACRQMLPVEKKDQKSVLRVERSNFVVTALRGLQKLSLQALRKYVTVEFIGEIAEDYGGPRRDFFGGLGMRLVTDLPALWRRLGKGALVPVADALSEGSPKDALGGMDDAKGAYQACGRACGLAAKTGDVIGEEFASFFLHQVARDDVVELEELQRQLAEADSEDDIRATGAILRKSLKDMGLQGQKLTRTLTNSEMEVELVPGGKDMEVTEDNKAQWLELHLHNKLYGSLQKAADAFRQGICDVFGGSRRTCPLLVLLTPAELAHLWAGESVGEQGLRRWREVAVVSEEVRQQADWLWEVLEEASEDFRGRLLRFSTGSSRVGQAGLQTYQVQPADGGDEALPRAMTCANMLQLPRYSGKEVLHRQLQKAMEFGDGFQIL